MKKQLLLLLLTAGCIPSIVKEQKDEKKGIQGLNTQTQAVRKCVKCRR